MSFRIALVTAVGLAASASGLGAPFIFYRGVVNAASFAPAGLPNGSIARGSIFTIFGREMGPAAGAQVTAFPLQDELAGVSVEVCQGETCLAAIPLFVRADQINAIMPSRAPLGRVSIRVRFNGETGSFTSASVVEASFGVFGVNSGGFGPGIVQNFVSALERPLNSLAGPARPGQVVTIWGTGLGAALNGVDNERPQAGDLRTDVEIFVGGKRVTNRLYAGRSPEFPGLDQINVEIPADAPAGCWVPVLVRAGTVVSNAITVALSADGGRCQESGNPFAPFAFGGRFGVVFLQRSDRLMDQLYGGRANVVTDVLMGTLREEVGSDFYFNPLFSPSPNGSCHVYTVAGDVFDKNALPGTRPPRDLGAGAALTVETADGQRRAGLLGKAPPAFYAKMLGAEIPGAEADGLIFDGGGPFTVRAPGGADVGAFAAEVTPGPQVTWTNRAQTSVIDRSAGVTLEFAGGDPSERMLSVWGGAYDRPTNVSTMFSCHADPSEDHFRVPAEVLSNVPASRSAAFQSTGWLGLAFEGGGGHAHFEAEGLDEGILIFSSMSARTVTYR